VWLSQHPAIELRRGGLSVYEISTRLPHVIDIGEDDTGQVAASMRDRSSSSRRPAQ
jgi:hypothetical protein